MVYCKNCKNPIYIKKDKCLCGAIIKNSNNFIDVEQNKKHIRINSSLSNLINQLKVLEKRIFNSNNGKIYLFRANYLYHKIIYMLYDLNSWSAEKNI